MLPGAPIAIGASASLIVAALAYRTRSLSLGGALAAVCVGSATVAGLGWPGALVLGAFFAPAIGLSRYGRARKRERLIDVGKTGPRDAVQVFANGGIAAGCALLAAHGDGRFVAAFAGAFAAAAADTWGTEVGTLARGRPRSLLTFRPIAVGLSGGVTTAGTLAEVAGAVVVACSALPLDRGLFALIALAGVAGALLDSALGASLQVLRYCPECARATERDPHVCGARTRRIRGARGIGNDAVNLAATLGGATVGYVFAPYFLSR